MKKYSVPSVGTNMRYTILKCAVFARACVYTLPKLDTMGKDIRAKEVEFFEWMVRNKWFTHVSR